MNREIKFRAWSTEDSKWAHIDLDEWQHSVGPMASLSNEAIPQTLELLTDDYFIWQQYTGLKDKNGVEIYEGDVLKPTESKSLWFVDYTSPTFIVHAVGGGISANLYADLEYEVIGNIYENPELLGAKS